LENRVDHSAMPKEEFKSVMAPGSVILFIETSKTLQIPVPVVISGFPSAGFKMDQAKIKTMQFTLACRLF
jgi:hypothetical protein